MVAVILLVSQAPPHSPEREHLRGGRFSVSVASAAGAEPVL